MKPQQQQMKSFIESECRSIGCEGLAAPLTAGFSTCYESMRVPSKEEYLAAMKHLRTLSPKEIAERNANASRIVDEILAEDKKKGEQDELRRQETRKLRQSTMVNPLTVDEFKFVLEKYGYRPVMHGGLWYGIDPARKNQFRGDYVFAELNGSMDDDDKCTARIRSTDGGAEYFDMAQFEEGVKKYFDARNAGDDPDDTLCESVEPSDKRRNAVMAEQLVEKAIRYLISNKDYYVDAHDTHRYIESDGWFELEFDLRGGSDPNTSVYLNTHNDYDQDFEDEWMDTSDDEKYGYDAIMWDPYTLHDYAYALENIIECDATRNDLPEDMVAEIVSFLKNAGYLKDIGTSGDKPACESIGDTVRGLFGKKKKPEDEELQDEFFIRPYGGPVHQPNRYPGLIWSILGSINCDHGGKITKEQALAYIKRLIPAIKDNPTDEAFERTLYRVVNAIE